MSPASQADLDSLIEQITLDAHEKDEQLMGFENAFDEDANSPCPGRAIGQSVEVLSVSQANGRCELIATCSRDGHRHQVALLDIDADPATSRLIAAYRRWNASHW